MKIFPYIEIIFNKPVFGYSDDKMVLIFYSPRQIEQKDGYLKVFLDEKNSSDVRIYKIEDIESLKIVM